MNPRKSKRPIELTRIIAMNWYGFNQVIEVSGNVVITGDFGTGKSALLDLIQRVLLSQFARYNRAATGEASKRTLKGYCLCDTNTGDDEGELFAREQTVTFIGLEFTWPNSDKRQTWGQRIEYETTTSKPSILYFMWPDRLDLDSTCDESGAFLEEARFEGWLKREGGDIWHREESYLDNLGVPANLNFHWDQLRQTLPEAAAFQIIRRFDVFMRERLLAASPLRIDEVKRSLEAHESYVAKLARYERQLGFLKLVREAHARAESARIDAARWRIVEKELLLRRATEASSAAEALLTSLRHDAEAERVKLEAVTRDHQAALAALASAQTVADKDAAVGKLDGLRTGETTLQKQIAALKVQRTDALGQIRERAQAWRRWIQTGRTLGAEMEKLPLDPRAVWLDALETGDLRAAPDALSALAEHYRKLHTSAILAQRAIEGRAEETKRKAVQLDADVKRLVRGQATGSFPLLDELRRRLRPVPGSFGPEQLCTLVEIKEEAEPWRRAIELFLRNNRFAIVLDSERFKISRRLIHELDFETRREPFIDPDEAVKMSARVLPGSLAEKLTAAHPVAESFIAHLLGNVMCVESIDDFPGKTRAITQDAILWQRPVLTKLGRSRRGTDDPFADFTPALRGRGLEKLREQTEQQLGLRQTEATALRALSDRWTRWIESGEEQSLGSAQLLGAAEIADRLATAEQNLTQTRLELEILATPEREAIVTQLQQLRVRAGELALDEDRLKRSKTIEELEKQTERAKTAAQAETDARRERENLHGEIGAGLRNEQIAAAADALCGEMREWPGRIERAGDNRVAARTLVEKEFGERDKQRALLRAEFAEFSRLDETTADNAAYEEEFRILDDQQVPEYRRKASQSRAEWEQRLKDHVLGELRTLTERAKSDLRELNNTLDQPIGHFRYRLARHERRDRDFDVLWQLIKTGFEPTDELAAAILDPDVERAKKLLMEAVANPDDTELRRRLDYREFFRFDMECRDIALSDEDAPWTSLTFHGGKMSGGENQSPFFLAMCAAFLRVYRRAEPGRLGQRESLGLVAMDEAFSKLSGEGVENCMQTARGFNLQLVLAMPDKDAASALHGANTILMVTIEKRREAGRTIIENWAQRADASETLAELETT